jgi:hypothetical protein
MSVVWNQILSSASLPGSEKKFKIISPKPVTRVRFAPSVIQSMKDFYEMDCDCRKAKMSQTCVSFTDLEVRVEADFHTGSAVIQYLLAMSKVCQKK